MTKFTKDQILMLERVIELTPDGAGIQNVKGSVQGDVFGSVWGYVDGKVKNDVDDEPKGIE